MIVPSISLESNNLLNFFESLNLAILHLEATIPLYQFLKFIGLPLSVLLELNPLRYKKLPR